MREPTPSDQRDLILYEYPFNERVRTFLRLEDLFDRIEFFARKEDPNEHHAALMTLFDVLDVTARADLRNDMVQELERHRQTLNGFRASPEVSAQALDQVLGQVDSAVTRLNALSGKTGQHLRDNEWLMSIRSRAIIAGGACEFDLPSYHAWQHRPADTRQRDLQGWMEPFRPLVGGLAIVLRLLRESARRSREVAQGGNFQQALGGKTYQMAQVRLDRQLGAIPEISANKYLLWIRFTSQEADLRPKAFEGNVSFELSLCNF